MPGFCVWVPVWRWGQAGRLVDLVLSRVGSCLEAVAGCVLRDVFLWLVLLGLFCVCVLCFLWFVWGGVGGGGWLVFVGVVVGFEWVCFVGLFFWRGCMRFAVLSCARGSYSTQRLRAAAVYRGHGVRVLNTLRFAIDLSGPEPDLLFGGRPLSDYDAVVPRIGSS